MSASAPVLGRAQRYNGDAITNDLIHDRGRGPEIVGTRITVYNLLEYLLDPRMTEGEICAIYELTHQQVAAARAYALTHADTVLAEHLRIEERMAAGNPPRVIEQARQTHEAFVRFQQWLRERDARNQQSTDAISAFPTFRDWLAEQSSHGQRT